MEAGRWKDKCSHKTRCPSHRVLNRKEVKAPFRIYYAKIKETQVHTEATVKLGYEHSFQILKPGQPLPHPHLCEPQEEPKLTKHSCSSAQDGRMHEVKWTWGGSTACLQFSQSGNRQQGSSPAKHSISWDPDLDSLVRKKSGASEAIHTCL